TNERLLADSLSSDPSDTEPWPLQGQSKPQKLPRASFCNKRSSLGRAALAGSVSIYHHNKLLSFPNQKPVDRLANHGSFDRKTKASRSVALQGFHSFSAAAQVFFHTPL